MSVLIQFFVTCIIKNTVTPFYSVACIPMLAIQQVLHLYIIVRDEWQSSNQEGPSVLTSGPANHGAQDTVTRVWLF